VSSLQKRSAYLFESFNQNGEENFWDKTTEEIKVNIGYVNNKTGQTFGGTLVSSCSNTGSIRDDPYWTSRKNSLKLIELSSIKKS
jgi:hypothetical protein